LSAAGGVARWRVLTARQRAVILDAVNAPLVAQPLVEARNRKPMRPNPVAPWELRVDTLRIYYDVAEGPELLVSVRSVGLKLGNRVRVGKALDS